MLLVLSVVLSGNAAADSFLIKQRLFNLAVVQRNKLNFHKIISKKGDLNRFTYFFQVSIIVTCLNNKNIPNSVFLTRRGVSKVC